MLKPKEKPTTQKELFFEALTQDELDQLMERLTSEQDTSIKVLKQATERLKNDLLTGLKNANSDRLYRREVRSGRTRAQSPPLARLSNVSDLLPSPKLRKRLKKMLADQAAHIDDLQNAGRFKAARWNTWCTWILWFWYLLKSPISSLLSVAKRSIS